MDTMITPRIPRLKGLTSMAIDLRLQPPSSPSFSHQKQRISRYIIGEYILNGYRILGQTVSLKDLALFLKLPLSRVMKEAFKGESLMIGGFKDPNEVREPNLAGLRAGGQVTEQGYQNLGMGDPGNLGMGNLGGQGIGNQGAQGTQGTISGIEGNNDRKYRGNDRSNSNQGNPEALLNMAFSLFLADRNLLQGQAHMLLRTQNDTFKPFLTAEVNKALKTLAESPKMLVDIYKARIAGQQIGIQIHNHHQAITNTQNNNITTNLVTIEKVIELAHENSKTLLDKGNSLAAKYDVHSMPIISAMDQTGVDNGRAGKAISLIKSQQIDIDNHLSRREKDLGLDS